MDSAAESYTSELGELGEIARKKAIVGISRLLSLQ